MTILFIVLLLQIFLFSVMYLLELKENKMDARHSINFATLGVLRLRTSQL